MEATQGAEVKARRLIGGLLAAVVIALVFARTASAVPIAYCDWAWWVLECWFAN
jgi:hypothetical protein